MLGRSGPIRSISDNRRDKLAALGIKLGHNSTFAAQRPDTGPSRAVRRRVAKRSGGLCEFPAWAICPPCTDLATDMHHRLNRKIGGRHGEAQETVNQAHWLLHCCRAHHAYVTSPAGHRRRTALAIGWLLLEGEDAAEMPALTRHDPAPVLLLPSGLYLVTGAAK